MLAQHRLVVAILFAQIDDRADPVLSGKLAGTLDWEAAADGDVVREPVEIGSPLALAAHSFFFIFSLHSIFFFIFS